MSKSKEELVLEYFTGPILAELPVGHGVHNFPIFIGAKTSLIVEEEGGVLEQAA
jgi:muramoyltetrapeptide carboxypeptidase